MIEQFPIYEYVGKLISWLPSVVLRWRYPEERLANLIYIDLQPRGTNAEVNLAGASTALIYLQLINLSPFAVELDRASFTFNVAGVDIEMAILNRIQLPAGSITSVPLRAPVPDGYADHIARCAPNTRSHLDGVVDFNCSVRQFQKRLNALQEIYPRLLNAPARNP